MLGQVIGRFIGNHATTSKQWPIARRRVALQGTPKKKKEKDILTQEKKNGLTDSTNVIIIESDNERSEGSNSESSESEREEEKENGTMTSQQVNRKHIEWPDSLKRYLVSVHKRCIDNPSLKTRVDSQLTKIIKDSIEDGSLYTRDWENNPPELALEKVRSRLSWTEETLQSSSDNSENEEDSVFSVSPEAPPPLKKLCTNNNGDEQHFGSEDALQRRLQRFSSGGGGNTTKSKNIIDVSRHKNMKKKIVGTCTTLEKPYTRSSVIIDLSTIRPEHILRRSFALAMDKHRTGKTDYYETNSQLLSIRQDMVVQGIRDAFAVSVYEAHGRLAILNKDLSGFNQCQGRLSALYAALPETGTENMPEFLAYRILYCILLDAQEEALEGAMAEIYKRGLSRHSADVEVAVATQKYVLFCNHARLFRVYEEFSGRAIRDTTKTLVDEIIAKYRDTALRNVMKVLIGTTTNERLTKMLGFKTPEEYREFIEHYSPVYNSAGCIDTKLTFANISKVPLPKVQVLYTVVQ